MSQNKKKDNRISNQLELDFDVDDEFGGAKNTIALIYRQGQDVDDDDDDEFGNAKNSIALIYHRGQVDDVDDNSTLTDFKIICKYAIFSPKIGNNQWFVDTEKMSNTIDNSYQSITIPLVIDTEFSENNEKKSYHQKTRVGLTTQIKSLDNADKGIVLAHSNQVNVGREMNNMALFPIIKSDFHVVDYLNLIGLESEVYEGVESDLRKLPKCYIILYGHFLTAELNIIFSGSLKEKNKKFTT